MKIKCFSKTCIRIWQTVMGSKKRREKIFSLKFYDNFQWKNLNWTWKKWRCLSQEGFSSLIVPAAKPRLATCTELTYNRRSFTSCREIMCMREWKREGNNQKKLVWWTICLHFILKFLQPNIISFKEIFIELPRQHL